MPECTVDYEWGVTSTQSRLLPANTSRVVPTLPTLLVACCLCLCLGCSSEEEGAKDPEMGAEPVTVEDANRIRNALDKAVSDRDRARFIGLFSKPDLYALVFDDIKISLAEQRKLESKVNRGGNVAALADLVFSRVRDGGNYQLVSQVEKEDGFELLYRLLRSDSNEIAYHRFDVIRGYKSKVRIRDVYFYLMEESLSERIRQRVLIELVSNQQLESISGTDLTQEIVRSSFDENAYNKYLESVSSEQWSEAWKQFDLLPENVQVSKKALMSRLLIAEKIGVEAVDLAVEQIRKLYPKNLKTEYFAYAYYKRISQLQKVIVSVDRMKGIVDDHYLDLLKLDALIQLGELPQAESIIDSFRETDIDPRRLLLIEFDLRVGQKRYADSVKILAILKSEHKIEVKSLDELPRYKELLESTEYQQWRQQNPLEESGADEPSRGGQGVSK